MRKTFGFCRSTSVAPMKTTHFSPKRAQTVAVATPCWPAPVSAMIRGLAHAPRQQDLAEHVVDLVRAGVVQLVALEVDLGAAQPLGQPLGEVERRGAADVVRPEVVHLGPEAGVGLRLLVLRLEVEDQRHQRLGDETPAEVAEAAALVGAGAEGVGLLQVHRFRSLGFAGVLQPGAPAVEARSQASSALRAPSRRARRPRPCPRSCSPGAPRRRTRRRPARPRSGAPPRPRCPASARRRASTAWSSASPGSAASRRRGRCRPAGRRRAAGRASTRIWSATRA